MVCDGKGKRLASNSLMKIDGDNQSLNHPQSQIVQRSDTGKNFMEADGRGYIELIRDSSEEIFLKTMMEGAIGMSAPTMEMLGFRNLSSSFRADSEELFNSWLMNGENNGYNSTSIAHRTRQASRRISAELSALSSHQNGNTFQKKSSNDILLPHNFSIAEEFSADLNQRSVRNGAESGMQASNLYMAKAWFHSSQPMTRSRSSELRKTYAAMQSFQASHGMEVMQKAGHGINKLTQNFACSPCDVPVGEVSNQLGLFMSSSNSPTSFNNPPIATVDAVSSVVSMLKGTLERKKLKNQVDKVAIEGSSFGFYDPQEIPVKTSLDRGPGNNNVERLGNFQVVSPIQVNGSEGLQKLDGTMDIDIDSFVTPENVLQMRTISQEPSQSESSAAAPVLSTGFEVCDGPTNSGQTPSASESSKRQFGNGFRERIEHTLKDDRKKGSIVRMGSVTSGNSVDKGDPTKKRRVERSRKMAEAKERNLTPAVPSDIQSILKRCENLEKEVRSLKLNLSFMNRKDSEQTKQIEELQKQNEELVDEKERLLEEIERIISESGKM